MRRTNDDPTIATMEGPASQLAVRPMFDPSTRYAAWKAPQEDGGVLLWPAASELLRSAERNNAYLQSADALVQNVALGDLRRSMRQFLGFNSDDQLVFATGHQTELHHPGVWAKNLLIDSAAKKTGGVAVHFAVDTDAPKHLSVRFPGYTRPFTDDESAAGADWAGLLAPPTPVHLQSISDEVKRASADWSFVPAAGPFFDCCRRLLLEADGLPAMLAAALHEYDWGMGLRYSAMLASPIWQSPAFLTFAHHLLANADRFAADYNAALRAYRERNGIKTPGRPMPNLAIKDDRSETALWRDDLSRGRRIRAWVEKSADGWSLTAGDDRLLLDPNLSGPAAADRLGAFLRRHNLRLSPRAITLTTTLRLFAADQFVHGIGGGQYDQVADDVMHRFLGIDPPAFSVTTATLFWPTAAGQKRTSIPDLLQRGHRLRHNVLGEQKRSYVHKIESAPRRSLERQALFQQLQQAIASAAVGSATVREWEQSLRDAPGKLAEERSIFDREILYAMQPKNRLERLIERYAKAVS